MKNLNIASNNHLLRQHKQTSIFEIGLLNLEGRKKKDYMDHYSLMLEN